VQLLIANPAVVLLDVQNDFFTGPLKVKRVVNVIEPLKRLVVASRKNDVPIVYAIDAHYPHDVEVVRQWGNHAIKGTEGAKVIAELEPDLTKDYVVEKRTYSGFYETGLDSLLRSLYSGEGAKTIVLGGLHTQLCIRHTAADAFFRGYHIITVKDGVEAFSVSDQEQGLRYLEYVYDAKILTVNEVIQQIVK
jgi:nicotinamidase-related amidase